MVWSQIVDMQTLEQTNKNYMTYRFTSDVNKDFAFKAKAKNKEICP